MFLHKGLSSTYLTSLTASLAIYRVVSQKSTPFEWKQEGKDKISLLSKWTDKFINLQLRLPYLTLKKSFAKHWIYKRTKSKFTVHTKPEILKKGPSHDFVSWIFSKAPVNFNFQFFAFEKNTRLVEIALITQI